MFNSKNQAVGVTSKCEAFRAAIPDGPIINVIDTPGLFDPIMDVEYLSGEIINCLSLAETGIHAVLFVLTVKNRVSPEEEATLNALQRIFESKILDYFIVVFTGGDELEADERTLDDYLSEGCPEFLTRVLRLCDGRKILLDNRTKDTVKKAEQLKQLLAHVGDVRKQTGGKPYTDKMHRKIKEENVRLREQERNIEKKNLAEAELALMKEKFRNEHEQSMSMIRQALEHTLHELKETFRQGPKPPDLCNIM